MVQAELVRASRSLCITILTLSKVSNAVFMIPAAGDDAVSGLYLEPLHLDS